MNVEEKCDKCMHNLAIQWKDQLTAYDFVYRFHSLRLGYDLIGIEEYGTTSVYIQKPECTLMMKIFSFENATPLEAIREVVKNFDLSENISLYEETIRGGDR